jgi:hypothetical protein
VLDHAEVVRLYGPWKVRTPREATNLLHCYPGRWWIAGGWAIDAFTATARAHGDLDIGIPRMEARTFIEFIGVSLDVWAAAGSLTPLPRNGSNVPTHCGNLWLRASGADPWEYNVLLDDVRDAIWVYKRAPQISRPLGRCLWSQEAHVIIAPRESSAPLAGQTDRHLASESVCVGLMIDQLTCPVSTMLSDPWSWRLDP